MAVSTASWAWPIVPGGYGEAMVEDLQPLLATCANLIDAFRNRQRRDEAESALQDLNVQLVKTNHELEQFVYTVSHDLKSPIVTLEGFVGHLKRDTDGGRTDRLSGFADRIQRATHRMRDNIDDLLELSRIGRVANEPEQLDVNGIVQELLLELKDRIDEVGVTIVVQNPMPRVMADRIRIQQVFDNLLTNALKYGCRGSERRVEVYGYRIDDEVHYCVSDTGTGVPEAYREKIFGLFQRLDTDSPGTGVGLAIVKRIIDTHDGRIWIESNESGGATFHLTLPSKLKAGHQTNVLETHS